MTTAVIFIDIQKHASKESIFAGCRFDMQALPRNSVGMGFMVWRDTANGGEITRLIDEPVAMTSEQERSWNETLRYAESVLMDDWDVEINMSLVL